MNLPPYLRAQASGEVMLSIKVQPRSSINAIGDIVGEELKIKVTAPPVDSAANEAVVELLAATLDCPKGALRIVRGVTSKHKLVAIRGMDPTMIVERLTSHATEAQRSQNGGKRGSTRST
jgi:uncharacterized protein (TIGR00251 family)